MMLYELEDRAKSLPVHMKLWMYPVAFLLTKGALMWVKAVDTFNRFTFRLMVKN